MDGIVYGVYKIVICNHSNIIQIFIRHSFYTESSEPRHPLNKGNQLLWKQKESFFESKLDFDIVVETFLRVALY